MDSEFPERQARAQQTVIAIWLSAALAGSTVTLDAVGDVMLGRGVQRRIASSGSPFARVDQELKRADVRFCNLECALSLRPFKVAKNFRLSASPETANWLRGEFDIASVSNNHALDCGPGGWRDTLASLSRVGVVPCGKGTQIEVIKRNGLRIGFVAFCDFHPTLSVLGDPLAYASKHSLTIAIAAARKVCDVVIVSIHWGIELSTRVSPRQRELANAAAVAGADVVLGHHPHVVEEVSYIQVGRHRTLVAYSLGNFVFDRSRPTEIRSAILQCRLSARGVQSARILPIAIRRYFPQIARSEPVRAIVISRRATFPSRRGGA